MAKGPKSHAWPLKNEPRMTPTFSPPDRSGDVPRTICIHCGLVTAHSAIVAGGRCVGCFGEYRDAVKAFIAAYIARRGRCHQCQRAIDDFEGECKRHAIEVASEASIYANAMMDQLYKGT